MTLPNYITLLRVFLVPFFFTALIYYQVDHDYYRWIAFSVFLFASVTDALDGFIVRKWKMGSELGTFLDPLADKLLLISAFIGLSVSSLPLKPPLWVVIIVIFRDIFILGGLAVVFVTTRSVKVNPNVLGKITTFFQMATILIILLQNRLAVLFWLITAGLTVASGIVYILREMKRLNHAKTTTNSS
ncbi:MAG: CDP-diacylglycerol--glycerol-3-phosphate 3-phosphatidyltransferase [Candidatus Omnitrophica bacterium]|nr:CDP-diacylglycerol--glycerol-3-phosphate 3-phosphatidyltransferase [Candidatus Omnitrophota bacterium]